MAPKGYGGRLRAKYGGTAAKRLVSIVDVDGPTNGAPNPRLTPRVSRRSVTLAMREHCYRPITVIFDNSMPRSPVSSKSALRHSVCSRCGERHSCSVPNNTVQHRSATQTTAGERGVDQALFVERTTLSYFYTRNTVDEAPDQLLAFESTHQVGSQILRAGSPQSNKRHPQAVHPPDR